RQSSRELLVGRRGSQLYPEELRDLFLEFEQRLSLLQPRLDESLLLTQLRELAISGVHLPRLRAAPLRIKRRQLPGLTQASPRRQMRRVQPLSPQDGPDLSGTTTRDRRVHLVQDALLVLRREPTPLRLRQDFGLPDRRHCHCLAHRLSPW